VDVVLFFEVHQPYRLRPDLHRVFPRLPSFEEMFYGELDSAIFSRVAERVYRKSTKILLEAAREVGLKATFSVSGLALEQLRRHAPDVLDPVPGAGLAGLRVRGADVLPQPRLVRGWGGVQRAGGDAGGCRGGARGL